jgi:hypothetical protein
MAYDILIVLNIILMEPGDWKCHCGETNFKKRDKCRKCNLPKRKPGDWNCLCGEMNFASRNVCRKCNTNKGAIQLSPQPKIIMKIGDWMCSNNNCNEHNFATRDLCRKCNAPKNAKSDPSNLECVICLSEPKTHAITKCGHLCYCNVCGFGIDKCPICRTPYDPDIDLLKIYNA